jgi:hypothetical protein
VGVQKYFLHAQMSIPCVECAITEIYLLLVARNLLKYILLLFFFIYFFLVLRRIVLVVACAKVVNNISRNFSLQSCVYSPQHNKGHGHHTYCCAKVVRWKKKDISHVKYRNLFHGLLPVIHTYLYNKPFFTTMLGPEIFPACPDVDSMCWMCNYRNIFIIGR